MGDSVATLLLTVLLVGGPLYATYRYKKGQRQRDETFKGMQDDARRREWERTYGRPFGIVRDPGVPHVRTSKGPGTPTDQEQV